MNEPCVFLDADVIFAAAAAPTDYGASRAVLRMAEIGLLDCVTSTRAVAEVERNLEKKRPNNLPHLRAIISASLRIVPNPEPEELVPFVGQAHPADLPLLVAALKEGCRYLLTFNARHYTRPPPPSPCSVRVSSWSQCVRYSLNWELMPPEPDSDRCADLGGIGATMCWSREASE